MCIPGWPCCEMAPIHPWGRAPVSMPSLSDLFNLLELLREEGEHSSANNLGKRELDLGRWILGRSGNLSFCLGFFLGSGLCGRQMIRFVPVGGGCQDVACHMDASQEWGWAKACGPWRAAICSCCLGPCLGPALLVSPLGPLRLQSLIEMFQPCLSYDKGNKGKKVLAVLGTEY